MSRLIVLVHLRHTGPGFTLTPPALKRRDRRCRAECAPSAIEKGGWEWGESVVCAFHSAARSMGWLGSNVATWRHLVGHHVKVPTLVRRCPTLVDVAVVVNVDVVAVAIVVNVDVAVVNVDVAVVDVDVAVVNVDVALVNVDVAVVNVDVAVVNVDVAVVFNVDVVVVYVAFFVVNVDVAVVVNVDVAVVNVDVVNVDVVFDNVYVAVVNVDVAVVKVIVAVVGVKTFLCVMASATPPLQWTNRK